MQAILDKNVQILWNIGNDFAIRGIKSSHSTKEVSYPRRPRSTWTIALRYDFIPPCSWFQRLQVKQVIFHLTTNKLLRVSKGYLFALFGLQIQHCRYVWRCLRKTVWKQGRSRSQENDQICQCWIFPQESHTKNPIRYTENWACQRAILDWWKLSSILVSFLSRENKSCLYIQIFVNLQYN